LDDGLASSQLERASDALENAAVVEKVLAEAFANGRKAGQKQIPRDDTNGEIPRVARDDKQSLVMTTSCERARS
ncbi:MAG: hypothetical protein ACRDMZ_20650, partial [Solirubrobacteraceae bacterium]